MSSGIGSAFVGDKPPHLPLNPLLARSGTPSRPNSPALATAFSPLVSPSPIPPLVSLELRIRWLEALISGVKPTSLPASSSKGSSMQASPPRTEPGLVRRTTDVQAQLNHIVESNDSLRKFMNSYDEHASLLTTSSISTILGSSTSTSSIPSYEDVSPEQLDILLSDMDADIRSADRDLREIQGLEKRGVSGAGKLLEHESLQPRLHALVQAHAEDLEAYNSLEQRINNLIQQYSSHINALSELFVNWNASITEAEALATKLEKEAAARQKTSFE